MAPSGIESVARVHDIFYCSKRAAPHHCSSSNMGSDGASSLQQPVSCSSCEGRILQGPRDGPYAFFLNFCSFSGGSRSIRSESTSIPRSVMSVAGPSVFSLFSGKPTSPHASIASCSPLLHTAVPGGPGNLTLPGVSLPPSRPHSVVPPPLCVPGLTSCFLSPSGMCCCDSCTPGPDATTYVLAGQTLGPGVQPQI